MMFSFRFTSIVPILIIYILPFVRTNLTCLSCQDSPIPRDCQYTAVCGQHEVCYTNSFITTAGSLRHELGCRDIRQCSGQIPVARSASDPLICTECCNGTLCNSGLCGQPAIVPLSTGSRGPLCYSCDQQLFPNTCHVIKECGRDEECMLTRFESQVGHDLIYSSNCVKKTLCAETLNNYKLGVNSESNPAILFGKRMTRVSNDSGVDHCVFKCCGTDLCNSDCSGTRVVHHVKQTSSAPGSFTTAPTSHAPFTAPPPSSTRQVKTTRQTTPWLPQTTTYTAKDCADAVGYVCSNYNNFCSMDWGLKNCRRTCNLCHVPLDTRCIDKTTCKGSLHLCNIDWGLQYCIRSCNRCSEI